MINFSIVQYTEFPSAWFLQNFWGRIRVFFSAVIQQIWNQSVHHACVQQEQKKSCSRHLRAKRSQHWIPSAHTSVQTLSLIPLLLFPLPPSRHNTDKEVRVTPRPPSRYLSPVSLSGQLPVSRHSSQSQVKFSLVAEQKHGAENVSEMCLLFTRPPPQAVIWVCTAEWNNSQIFLLLFWHAGCSPPRS